MQGNSFECKRTISAMYFIFNIKHATINLNKVYLLHDNPNIFTRVRTWQKEIPDKQRAYTLFKYVVKS